MTNPAFRSKNVEKLLNAAFETSDLKRICRAIDAAVLQSGSIIEVARAAKLDRVTLYRAFRLENGPALDNMIKVLRVLGFRLVVEVGTDAANKWRAHRGREHGKKPSRYDCLSLHGCLQDRGQGVARQGLQRNLACTRKRCGVRGQNDQDA